MLPSPRLFVFAGIAAVLLLGVVYHNFGQDKYSLHDIASISIPSSGLRTSSKGQELQALFSAVAQPINAEYTDPSGKTYELPQTLHWTKPLGRRILLVDIDTRMPDGENELFGKKPMEWATHKSEGGGLVSNGIMDHYLYAQIHGYEYKYYHAQKMDGYYDTWIRPHILASLLKDYDFVVTLDADITVTHMDVPLEWLFNRWNITSRTSISMPWDVEEQRPDTHIVVSQDSKGLQVYNAGFVIAQNLPLTFELLQAWGNCPTEERYEGCAHWKENWSHEQRAFSEYIRYDFNPQGDNIVPIACDDAMAWPGAPEQFPGRILSDCHGNFFRHHTLHKDRPREEFQDAVMQLMTRLLQEKVAQNVDTVLFTESNVPNSPVEEAQP